MSKFKTYWVSPKRPTTLDDQEWLPLPPSDHPFYPMVNTWTVPAPLDTTRLQEALEDALALYPLNASQLARNPANGLWQLQLLNRAIPLTIGDSDRAGPFAKGWRGEKDPDYYDELPRHGNSLEAYSLIPLTKLRVTTYKRTGETSIMLSQSYNLGDGFAVMGFMTAWSSYYQGKVPDFVPSFEKYFVPNPVIEPSASHSRYIDKVSWLTVNFDDKLHDEFTQNMVENTERVDMHFNRAFVQAIRQQARTESGNEKLSRGDAFASYIITILGSVLDQPPRFVQQCVGYRGQTLQVGGYDYFIPRTSMGNNYLIYTLDLEHVQGRTNIGNVALALNQSRRELTDDTYLSKIYAYYSYFYERASSSHRMPIDAGHKNAIAINNCIKLDLTAPHFGFPDKSGHIEWEVLENFVQIMDANPVRRRDGTYFKNVGDVSIVTRLRKDVVVKFRANIEADIQAWLNETKFGEEVGGRGSRAGMNHVDSTVGRSKL